MSETTFRTTLSTKIVGKVDGVKTAEQTLAWLPAGILTIANGEGIY